MGYFASFTKDCSNELHKTSNYDLKMNQTFEPSYEVLVQIAYARAFAAHIDKAWNVINMLAIFTLIARLSSKTVALAINDVKLLDSTTC